MNLWAETAASLKRWEGLGLVVVALACLAFQLSVPGVTPSEADFQQAAAAIDQDAKPGDVVLLTPWWAERARVFVSEKTPVVGWYGSDAEDFTEHPRIWVLANVKAPRFSWSGFLEVFGPRRTEVGDERRFGPLAVRLYTNGRARAVRFSAREALASAKVYLEGAGGQQPCGWNGRSFRCPNGAEVVTEWHELAWQPHRCIRFFPPGGPTRLVAEFSNVPAADVLRLTTGYIWERFGSRADAPTDFGVEVNGDVQTTPIARGLEKVWRVERPNTAAGTVRAWVQAPDSREVCFELTGFGPEGA
ncbi:MAG: hypothetical protein SFW67_14475 [Myxococcaceae bacterium]|nr:hypothetical protein [Myxococcaceae bacterium]